MEIKIGQKLLFRLQEGVLFSLESRGCQPTGGQRFERWLHVPIYPQDRETYPELHSILKLDLYYRPKGKPELMNYTTLDGVRHEIKKPCRECGKT